jgi:hypothetical protein
MANDDGYSYWDDILGSYWENQLFVVVSYQYLAGGWALPLWKMMEFFISADDIPRMEKNNMFQTWKKTCSKPPTRNRCQRFPQSGIMVVTVW